jgi:hypothetical protein
MIPGFRSPSLVKPSLVKLSLRKDDGSVSLHLTTEPRETDGVKDQTGGVL